MFADRGLEYMNGWRNVLEAMQEAVTECQKELEKNLAEKSRLKEETVKKILVEKETLQKEFPEVSYN